MVNGLDTSKPIEVAGSSNIIIGVAGQTNEQKESYSVTCEMGGKLKPFTEPNTLAEMPILDQYLFTFEDNELDWAMVNLTVGDVLDYQLILFNAPDANTIIFGIDSDAIEIPETESEPEPEPEPETFLPLYEQTIVPYTQRMEKEKARSLKFCPTGVGLISVTGHLPDRESKGRELLFDGCQGGMTGGRGVIDVTSDITSNTVWTSDNTYHVLADISVQALLVIEPNTTVIFAPDKSMSVNNGGTLISVGTPDNPIIYTSDSGTPDYDDYYCPMYIEETATANTKIMYSYVEYAYVGLVVLNNELETDIQNNYFYNNVYGIVEQGIKHTSIRNNLVVASYHSGIEVFLADTTGQASSDSFVLIENNTCDFYQDCGIRIHGVPDANNAGWVVLSNNLVSGSYQYGVYLLDPDEWVCASVLNTGYYDNANNKNWDFEEENPAFENVLPYEMGTGILPVCYLRQDCNFVNTGSLLIEQIPLIGQTTDVTEFPDSNYVDIGFHYPNWQFSNADVSTSADLDGSLTVDFNDFAIFAENWQQSTSGDADLDGSGFVDYNDLSIFTNQWLQFADPNIEIHIYGDSNEGYVDIGISGFTSDTQRAFLLADGEYVREIFSFRNSETLTIDISEFGNRAQQLKVVSVNNTRHLTCSNIKSVAFSCPLNYCLLPSSYEPNEPLHFSAFNPADGDVSVKVYADGGDLVWSQIYSGNSILGSIPAQITSQYEIDYVSFDTAGGQSIAKLTDPVEPPHIENVQALIIITDWRRRLFGSRSISRVQKAFKSRGVDYAKLSGKHATYDKVAWYARNKNIRYIYIFAHGNYRLQKALDDTWLLRTVVELIDGPVVSIKRSDFIDPNSAPSWCENLEIWEDWTKSFYSMGFSSLEFVQFDTCWSGRLKINANNQLVEGQPGQIGLFDGPHSDMSLALGMGETSISRVYQGWYGQYYSRLWPWSTEYQQWTWLEWEELGNGENLYWALMHVIGEQIEFGPDAPVNNYRLKGQGSLMDIELD